MRKLKICVVTGSRADYGLLYWLMKLIQQDSACELQVAVTGMHLSGEFGFTFRSIEEDGFTINEKVETVLSDDSPTGVAKSVGMGIIGFAGAFARSAPEIVVVLGDRYEIFAAVQAAFIAGIPIAHLAGGDVTEGSIDEGFRHSMTKLSHLHFVSNPGSRQRVIQMGEDPSSVYLVGSTGIDYLKRSRLLSRMELEKSLDFKFAPKNLLVTFHAATADSQAATAQFQEVLDALGSLSDDTAFLFTGSNSDVGGRQIMAMAERFVEVRGNASLFTSLGQLRYLSLISQVDVVVGNSSSGLLEVPSFKKPTVNIGSRQEGRIKAASVIDCLPVAAEIKKAILAAYEKDCSSVVNPYGDGDASSRILSIIKKHPALPELRKKKFFELGAYQNQS